MTSMTFGTMPARKDFNKNFARICKGSNNKFSFGNDPIVGTCELTSNELWEELQAVHLQSQSAEGDNLEKLESWLSCVLSVLEFE